MAADPYARLKAEAERKMAIMDALPEWARRTVHEIGLSRFSKCHIKVYREAKRAAGIGARLHHTQDGPTARRAAKGAA